MPIDSNDFSVNNIILDSQIQSEDFASRVVGNARGGRANLTQALKDYKSVNTGNIILKFPSETPKYYMEMRMFDYSRTNLFRINIGSTKNIILPLTQSITDHDSVDYEIAELGIAAGNTLQGGYGVKNAITNAEGFDAKQAALSAAQAFLGAGAAILGARTQPATPNSAQALSDALINQNNAQVLTGYSPNQFFTVLLKGPKYKSYQFAWKLFPKNRQESEAINQIIIEMQNAKAVGTELNGALWSFPKLFQLAYHPNSKYLHKFKPSVLVDFTADYAPGGAASFYATPGDPNPPEAVLIAAQFLEIEYWLKGDYNDSNDPFTKSVGSI